MAEPAKREHKDRLFKDIFSDRKRLLSLYNAVNGSRYADEGVLEVNTLEDSVFAGMRNDISFLFYAELSLYEHQSTYCPNMPLRGLMYFARIYEKILAQRGKKFYAKTLVKIPTPKFVVFYNGLREAPDKSELRLSDAFEAPDKSGRFEWTCEMVNINAGRNVAMMENCEGLEAYAIFVARVRANMKGGMKKDPAVDEALEFAIKKNLLGGYFKLKKAEVKAMSIFEFDQEEYGQYLYNEGIEQGIEQGREEGIESMIISLDKQGFPIEAIATAAKMTVGQVEEIIERAAVEA